MKSSRFLAGWEIDFHDKGQLSKILLTHGIDEYGIEVFTKLQTATEIIIEDNKIIKVLKHSNDGIDQKEIQIELPIKDWPDRKLFFLHKNENGMHSIGGQKPDGFNLPVIQDPLIKCIYISTIDGTDNYFKWLQLEKLHLCYPMYNGAYPLYFNYQDPENPTLLNSEVINFSWIDRVLPNLDKVEFVKTNYHTIEHIDMNTIENNRDDILFCGVPLWYQYPNIPTCPKTGKVMQFVATINSDRKISIQNKIGLENKLFGDYLIFGDYGNLFIFYQPESSIVYMDVQF